MKTGAIVATVIGAVFLLLGVTFIGTWISVNNWAATQEQNIIAQKDSARNILGQYAPTLKEALGVTKLQTSAVRDVITGANESRYGGDDSEATVQFIQEQNPNLDQATFRRVQDIIEAGRRDFREAQKAQIDRVREYRTGTLRFPTSFFLGLTKYPTANFFEQYGTIVVSGHANDAFTTGIDDGIDTGNFK